MHRFKCDLTAEKERNHIFMLGVIKAWEGEFRETHNCEIYDTDPVYVKQWLKNVSPMNQVYLAIKLRETIRKHWVLGHLLEEV